MSFTIHINNINSNINILIEFITALFISFMFCKKIYMDIL